MRLIDNVCERPPISQKIEPEGKSICWSCFHWAVCFAKKNQPCVRCSRYLTTADVAPVVHGEWKVDKKGYPQIICSLCDVHIPMVAGWCMDAHINYCPNCGAKMEGERE